MMILKIKTLLQSRYRKTESFVIILLAVQFCTGIRSSLVNNYKVEYTGNDFESIIQNIIDRHYFKVLLICMDPKEKLIWMDSFLQSYYSNTNHTGVTLFCHDEELHRHERKYADSFLIVLHNTSDNDPIFRQIQTLDQSYVWNSQVQFIVVVLDAVNIKDEQRTVQIIVNELWKLYDLNIVVLISSWRSDTRASSASIKLYSWFPSDSKDCGRNVTDVIVLDKYSAEETGDFEHKIDRFPKKIPYKFNDCLITVSAAWYPPFIRDATDPPLTQTKVNKVKHCANHELSEIVYFEQGYEDDFDAQLVLLVACAYGFQLRFVKPTHIDPVYGQWGGQLDNGTWTGAVGDVLNKRADLACGGFMPDEKTLNMLDMTFPHVRDGFIWYVPRAEKIPSWKALTLIFNINIWTLLLLSYILTSIVTYLQSGKDSITVSALKAWSILIGVSLKRQPEPLTSRCFFAIWVFCSLLYSTAYQSNLVGVMTHPGYEKQILNLKDLADSKVPYRTTSTFLKYFVIEENGVTKTIYDNLQRCDLGDCMQRINRGEKFAMYVPKAGMIELLKNKQSKQVYVPLEQESYRYDIVMYLRRNSPFANAFNTMFMRLREAGILYKLWSEASIEESFQDIKRRENQQRDQRKVLTLEHLEGVFSVSLLGLMISTIVLISEIIYHRRFHNREIRN